MAHTHKVAHQIVDVVGENFSDIVLSPNHDVLLYVFAKDCAASKALFPLIEYVNLILTSERQLPGNTNRHLFIAKMDKAKNDFPVPGVKITHFPTLFLFPAGDFTSPKYKYVGSFASIISLTAEFTFYKNEVNAIPSFFFILFFSGIFLLFLTPRFFDYADYNGSKIEHVEDGSHSHFTAEIILKFLFDHICSKGLWSKEFEDRLIQYHSSQYVDSHGHSHLPEHTHRTLNDGLRKTEATTHAYCSYVKP